MEYVDLFSASHGHDVCKPDTVHWIEPIVPHGHVAAQVHPNRVGMAAWASLVAAQTNSRPAGRPNG